MRGRLALIASLLVAAAVSNADAADDRPNVVLIVADDLGWADLGCYGSTFYRTPNLDRLASGGRRFTQAYAACPVCSPTRAAIMTGKSPARLNLTDWLPGRVDMPSQKLNRPEIRQQLPLEEVTLAEALKAQGYATGHVGKWHLGGDGFGPTQQGFDVNVAGNASGSPPGYFGPFVRAGTPLPGLEDAPKGEYLTDRLAAEAEKFIEAHKAEPFFLYLPHFAVHIPLQAKADLVGGYAKWDGTPHGRQENPVYAALLQSLDEAVGRVVASLEKAGLTGKTFVIFTSDNGGLATSEGANTPATINAPLREGKGWLYEGGIRVPLIVSRPGVIATGVEPTPVWSADLFPTLAAFCGSKTGGPFDGMSLADLLTKGTPLPARPLFWHYPHYSNQGGRPGAAVRDGDWKLVEFYENGRRELYDLGRDARESTNLAEKNPAKVEELAAKLGQWRRSVDARMPTPNPGYKPNPQAEDGSITLTARTAEVHGVMLRYEPLPHKNTLGFWTRADDWASWEFEVTTPGTFKVAALVGCGKGSGGSRVEFRVGADVLTLTVPETGGFQAFQTQELGRVTVELKGRHRLEVRATSKPGPAVMDLREVRLVPVGGDQAGVGGEPITITSRPSTPTAGRSRAGPCVE